MADFEKIIHSEDEIRELVGYPSELVKNKVVNSLDESIKEFISRSPLLFISSADEHGYCDVSPRGDAAGFVHIVDEKRMVIPERPGNRRIDTMRNILRNPKVGLIFVIPGLGETLRINGSAYVMRDEALLDKMQVSGKSPLFGIGVVVEECYVHCAKAFIRSRLWDSESWLDKKELPSPGRMLSQHAKRTGISEQEVSKALDESYAKRLY